MVVCILCIEFFEVCCVVGYVYVCVVDIEECEVVLCVSMGLSGYLF